MFVLAPRVFGTVDGPGQEGMSPPAFLTVLRISSLRRLGFALERFAIGANPVQRKGNRGAFAAHTLPLRFPPVVCRSLQARSARSFRVELLCSGFDHFESSIKNILRLQRELRRLLKNYQPTTKPVSSFLQALFDQANNFIFAV